MPRRRSLAEVKVSFTKFTSVPFDYFSLASLTERQALRKTK
jgi:hypothetical protein